MKHLKKGTNIGAEMEKIIFKARSGDRDQERCSAQLVKHFRVSKGTEASCGKL